MSTQDDLNPPLPTPYVDFTLGDFITLTDWQRAQVSQRVQSLTGQVDDATGNVLWTVEAVPEDPPPVGLLVAAGVTGQVVTSRDGILWTPRTFGVSTQIEGVGAAPSLMRFVADGGSLPRWSDDGITWTAATGSGITNGPRDFAWSPELGLWVAVGDNGAVKTSPDGKVWTNRTSGFSGSLPINAVCWSPELSLFVAVGNDNRGTRSADGITWTGMTDLKFGTSFNSIYGIAWSPTLGMFVAFGDQGKTCYSTNGSSWTFNADVMTGGATPGKMCWSPALGMFAVGATAGILTTSTDGIAWTGRTSGFGAERIHEVTWSDDIGLFVAVGTSGRISTSPDGVTWTVRTSNFSGTIYGVKAGLVPA